MNILSLCRKRLFRFHNSIPSLNHSILKDVRLMCMHGSKSIQYISIFRLRLRRQCFATCCFAIVDFHHLPKSKYLHKEPVCIYIWRGEGYRRLDGLFDIHLKAIFTQWIPQLHYIYYLAGWLINNSN